MTEPTLTLCDLVDGLKDALEVGTMERASFSRLHPGTLIAYPTCEDEVDEFIKSRTDLWRRTWLMGPVNRAITELNARIVQGENDREEPEDPDAALHALARTMRLMASSLMDTADEVLNKEGMGT